MKRPRGAGDIAGDLPLQASRSYASGNDVFAMGQENELRVNSREGGKSSIRILIADDHPIVRQELRALLSSVEDFDVVGEAADGREVLDKVQELDPDVLLLDPRMPQLDGQSTLLAMAQLDKYTRVIVLMASEDRNALLQAIKLGCSGIVRKSIGPELIVKIIRKIHGGEGCHPSRNLSLAPTLCRASIRTLHEPQGGLVHVGIRS